MHQQRHRHTEYCAGEERNAVLGVDHGIRGDPFERPETEPTGGDGAQSAGIHRQTTTTATDPDAVDDLLGRSTGIGGRPQRDTDTSSSQARAYLLEVALAAAALRMPGIAPAQQQNLAHRSLHPIHRARFSTVVEYRCHTNR